MQKFILSILILLMFNYSFSQVQSPIPSPRAKIAQKVGLVNIDLDYSRPSKKGRIIFGNLKTSFVVRFKDVNFLEFSILLPLLFFVLYMGVYPSFFSNFIHLSVCNLSLVTLY